MHHDSPIRQGRWKSPRALPMLMAGFVLLRLLFHAFYLPVYEGPDEPFHLARIQHIVDEGPRAALTGDRVSGQIVASIKAHPCGDSLHRAFGCSPFAGSGAFNILDETARGGTGQATQNYEAHQPPLYYLLGAGVVFLLQTITPGSASLGPESSLLAMRLLSVALVAVAMGLLWRRFVNDPKRLTVAFAILALPGAAESLARCANDSAVFLWAVALIWAVWKDVRVGWIVVLVGIGPIIKMTAVPVSLFGVTWLFVERRKSWGLVAVFSMMLGFLLQGLRGWAWGGTVEFNAAAAKLDESALEILVGFGRTVYTFFKTTWWLGGWSFFRPPLVLVVISFLVVLAWIATQRIPTLKRQHIPHYVALAVIVAAFTTFAFKHRLYFGTWGGVGGWYAWGWFPLFLQMAHDVFEARRRPARIVAFVFSAFLVAANLLWFIKAAQVYGP